MHGTTGQATSGTDTTMFRMLSILGPTRTVNINNKHAGRNDKQSAAADTRNGHHVRTCRFMQALWARSREALNGNARYQLSTEEELSH